MKAKKLVALLLCILTACVLMAFSASAEDVTRCDCGEEYYQWVTVPQTCTSKGTEKHMCTNCGEVFITYEIPAHNFVVIYTAKQATCVEEGYETVYCDWCKTIEENRVIPVDTDNHSYGEWTVTKEPTCKDEGEQERECTRPGCSHIEKAVIPTDSSKHDAGDNKWELVKAPTCTEEGKEKSLCTVCNTVFTRPIAVHYDYATNTDKFYLVEKVEANCNVRASEKYFCRDCGLSFVIEGERDYDKHDYTDEALWYYSADASCKHPGTLTKYCKNNRNHTVTETYAPHIFEGAEVITEAPGCNANGTFTEGKKTVKCIYCDEVKTETVTDTHSFGEWSFTDDNCSCKTGGTATRTCTCGAVTETKDFEAGTHLNYTYDAENIVYPDCEHDGFMYIYCADCQVTARVFLPELDSKGAHTPGEWVVTEEATCDKSGIKELYCDICDEVMEKQVLPQRVHSCVILRAGTAATCETAGITDYLYCTLCETPFEQEVIPALGHHFVDQFAPEEGSAKFCDRCNSYGIAGDNGETVTCKCLCHNSNGLAKTLWKFVIFFCKLFGFNQECKCGAVHF